ncbi:MAG: transporter substrate-binding domain-containing protein [Paucibacter sp.]|nr:transporter substrate-binding domain-containing protein [Roseateles sp.]
MNGRRRQIALLLGLALVDPATAGVDLRILSVDEPPTNFLVNGRPTGFVVEVIERLEQDLGIHAPIETVPTPRAFSYLKREANVLAITFGKTPEREALGIHFLGPITTRNQIVWIPKGKALKISSHVDIASQKLLLGSPVGDWRTQYFKDRGVRVDASSSHAMDLRHLQRGMIDLCAMSDLEFPYVARAAGVDAADFEPAYVFAQATQGYIVFSRSTPVETIERWERAFKELQKTDFFDKTARKWSSPESPLRYSRSMGFYRER